MFVWKWSGLRLVVDLLVHPRATEQEQEASLFALLALLGHLVERLPLELLFPSSFSIETTGMVWNWPRQPASSPENLLAGAWRKITFWPQVMFSTEHRSEHLHVCAKDTSAAGGAAAAGATSGRLRGNRLLFFYNSPKCTVHVLVGRWGRAAGERGVLYT